MSGLIYLTTRDFKVSNGPKGPVLCNRIRGLSFVLFYANKCERCKHFMPLFKTLPYSVQGCQFAMINVSQNSEIVSMSRETIAPINYVPFIIMYVNGRPFMRYDGAKNRAAIAEFIMSIANTLQSKREFSKPKSLQSAPVEKKEKPNLFGNPKCDGDVCYLAYEKAY
jgi:thioredoxin-like negative regulator of GroEL